jgi:Ca2+:H+ antiporter
MSDPAADGTENIDSSQSEGGRPAEHMPWPLSSRMSRMLLYGDKNVLLVFVPIGIAAGALGWPAKTVFILNCLAVIPLAPIITFSIDELSPIVGHRFDELLKPTSGNAVEMIVRCLSNVADQFAFC